MAFGSKTSSHWVHCCCRIYSSFKTYSRDSWLSTAVIVATKLYTMFATRSLQFSLWSSPHFPQTTTTAQQIRLNPCMRLWVTTTSILSACTIIMVNTSPTWMCNRYVTSSMLTIYIPCKLRIGTGPRILLSHLSGKTQKCISNINKNSFHSFHDFKQKWYQGPDRGIF